MTVRTKIGGFSGSLQYYVKRQTNSAYKDSDYETFRMLNYLTRNFDAHDENRLFRLGGHLVTFDFALAFSVFGIRNNFKGKYYELNLDDVPPPSVERLRNLTWEEVYEEVSKGNLSWAEHALLMARIKSYWHFAERFDHDGFKTTEERASVYTALKADQDVMALPGYGVTHLWGTRRESLLSDSGQLIPGPTEDNYFIDRGKLRKRAIETLAPKTLSPSQIRGVQKVAKADPDSRVREAAKTILKKVEGRSSQGS